MTENNSAPEHGWIDVHCHYMPPMDPAKLEALLAMLKAKNFTMPPEGSWTPEKAIEFMDARDIGVQMLSHPFDLDGETAPKINNYGASVVAGHPGRFGLLANLPMRSPKDAVAEIGRALDELDADGFIIVSNYDGDYLGHPRFDEVFAELDRREATVFLHPTDPAGYDLVANGRPGPVMEFPIDTARTVVDAVYAEVFSRYPNFNLILAHAGGPLTSLAARIASVGTSPWVPNPRGVDSEGVSSQLASLYYDTALAGGGHSLLPVLETTTTDHVLFGTDFPPGGIDIIDQNIDALTSGSSLASADLADISANTLRLFPKISSRLTAGSKA